MASANHEQKPIQEEEEEEEENRCKKFSEEQLNEKLNTMYKDLMVECYTPPLPPLALIDCLLQHLPCVQNENENEHKNNNNNNNNNEAKTKTAARDNDTRTILAAIHEYAWSDIPMHHIDDFFHHMLPIGLPEIINEYACDYKIDISYPFSVTEKHVSTTHIGDNNKKKRKKGIQQTTTTTLIHTSVETTHWTWGMPTNWIWCDRAYPVNKIYPAISRQHNTDTVTLTVTKEAAVSETYDLVAAPDMRSYCMYKKECVNGCAVVIQMGWKNKKDVITGTT